MNTEEIVLRKIANGLHITFLPKHNVKIENNIYHYRNDKLNPNGKYPFNINPNTLKADYEVWICGNENTFYVIPIDEIQKIYSDPDAYANTTKGQENIRTLDINITTNKVKYGRNREVDFSAYRNKLFTGNTHITTVLISQAEATVKKYGLGGEGEEHLSLKNEIANNPSLIGIYNVNKVENDNHIFPSSDRPDIVFTCNDDTFFVVEIEIENCLPGAFQAIKYKALYCAEKGFALNSDKVTTILVARKINATVIDFCTKYGVKVVKRDAKD